MTIKTQETEFTAEVPLEEAFNVEGPSLVVIPIDYRENPKLTERLGNIACPI